MGKRHRHKQGGSTAATTAQPAQVDYGSNSAQQEAMKHQDLCDSYHNPDPGPLYALPEGYVPSEEKPIDARRAEWYADGKRDRSTGQKTEILYQQKDGTRTPGTFDVTRSPSDVDPDLWAVCQYQTLRANLVTQERMWFEEPFEELAWHAQYVCKEPHAKSHARELGAVAQRQGKIAIKAIDEALKILDKRHIAEQMVDSVKISRDLVVFERDTISSQMALVPELIKKITG